MSYESLENDIITRLSTGGLSASVDIEAAPETEADYEEPFARPRISVSYQKSEYGGESTQRGYPKNLATNVAASDEFAEVHIVLRARLIRGTGGIYWLHEQVKKRLFGYYMPGWNRIFPQSFEYLGHNSGIWVYDLVVKVRRIGVQELPDDTTNYPLLQNITIQTT